MNNYTRILILLFAVMFFFVYNTPAFASVTRCFESEGIVRCIQPDGKMITIVKG